jgi:hypothetical protein
MKEVQKLAKAQHAGTIIVATAAPMGRYVSPELETFANHGFDVLKVAKNMINFPPQRIHAHLAQMGLVPEQKRLAA